MLKIKKKTVGNMLLSELQTNIYCKNSLKTKMNFFKR